jgi:hypothetical protein
LRLSYDGGRRRTVRASQRGSPRQWRAKNYMEMNMETTLMKYLAAIGLVPVLAVGRDDVLVCETACSDAFESKPN